MRILFVAAVCAVVASALPSANAQKLAGAQKKLDPFIDKLSESSPPQVEETRGGWKRWRYLNLHVPKSAISSSDFAAKPLVAKVTWKVHKQDSKIYPTAEEAAKGEWLSPGKIAGAARNAFTRPGSFTATFYLVDGQWRIEELSWGFEGDFRQGIQRKAFRGDPSKDISGWLKAMMDLEQK